MRRLGAVVTLVLVGTIVGLALVEVGVRSFACVDRVGGGMNVYNRYFGWGNRPSVAADLQRCVAGKPEWQSVVSINRWGLRGGDVAQRASAGVVRILVLGDSFAHGAQVDDGAVFTARLARELSTRTELRVEVLNAAVNGWATDNAVLYFEHEGWRLEPDLVLLAFDTTNDVFENARRMVGVHPFYADKPYFALDDGHLERRHYPLDSEGAGSIVGRAAVGRAALGRRRSRRW
jgi:hypothetical protein